MWMPSSNKPIFSSIVEKLLNCSCKFQTSVMAKIKIYDCLSFQLYIHIVIE